MIGQSSFKRRHFMYGFVLIMILGMSLSAAPQKKVFPVPETEYAKDKNTIVLLRFNEGKGDFVRDYGINRNIYKLKHHKWQKKSILNGGVLLGDNPLKISAVDFAQYAEWTAEIWVDMKGQTDKNQYIFYVGQPGNNGYGLLVDKTGKLCLRFGGKNQFQTDYTLPQDKWTHLCLECKDGHIRCFANGMQIFIYKYGYISPANTLMLSSNSMPFNGVMDEFRFSNTARYTVK